MRKLAIFLALLPLITAAQVRVASAAPQNEQIKFRYDSTKNAMRFAEYYIGQDLFVIPTDDAKNVSTYYRFGRKVEMLRKSTILKDKPNTEEVKGHTFHVVGRQDFMLGGRNETLCGILVMVDKETGDTIYYSHDINGDKLFPFITLGFKDKFEKNNKDKRFVFRSYSLYDFETGEKIDAHKTTWTFKEIIAMPDKMEPGYYLVNDAGASTAVTDMSDFIKEADIKSYTKKYGKAMVDEALDGNIRKGMPTDLVKIAKGQPDKINSASYGQQWVYKNMYIYIKDGKVSGWN